MILPGLEKSTLNVAFSLWLLAVSRTTKIKNFVFNILVRTLGGWEVRKFKQQYFFSVLSVCSVFLCVLCGKNWVGRGFLLLTPSSLILFYKYIKYVYTENRYGTDNQTGNNNTYEYRKKRFSFLHLKKPCAKCSGVSTGNRQGNSHK